jgi:hypothetical protein
MNKHSYLVLASLSLFAAALTFYYGSTPSNKFAQNSLSASTTVFVVSDTGMSFSYPEGGNGYRLKELQVENVPGLKKMIVLSKTNDDSEQIAAVAMEEPPTISLSVYANDREQQPEDWANEHKLYSNIGMKITDPAELVIGGANAIRYATDGLYRTDNVVIAHNDEIYVLSGSYLDEEAEIHKDFLAMLGTIEFAAPKDRI